MDVSRACLAAVCERGHVPALAVGYDSSRAGASGFADLGPLADRHGFELVRTADVNDPALVDRIEKLEPRFAYVIGWSQLIRRRLLELPGHGCVGIHPTKLPVGRGRAPIPWTILKGLARTASTMFFLTEGVDDGDVIDVVELDVAPREDAGTLYAKHRDAHVELVCRQTARLLEGQAAGSPQDHSKATYWEKRSPEDGRIDWTLPATDVDRLVRAVTRPFPGAFFDGPSGRVTIWRAEPGPELGECPATIVRRDGELCVACGTGSLRVIEADGL